MTKEHLKQQTAERKAEITEVINVILANLNNGQRKKLLNNANVKEVFKHFGIEV